MHPAIAQAIVCVGERVLLKKKLAALDFYVVLQPIISNLKVKSLWILTTKFVTVVRCREAPVNAVLAKIVTRK